jgi:hypothetical protein
MKSLDEIEKEYSEFNIDLDEDTREIHDFQDFMAYMGVGLEEILKQNKTLKRQKIIIKCEDFIGNIINLFTFGDREEIEVICLEDISIMDEEIDISYSVASTFADIIMIASEENYSDLLKLSKFIAKYYFEHISYLSEERKSLIYRCKGINYFNNKYQYNREVVDLFVKSVIKQYSDSQIVENVKKM